MTNLDDRQADKYGAIVVALVALVMLAELNFGRHSAANTLNVHTYDVLGEAGSVLEDLINIETGNRPADAGPEPDEHGAGGDSKNTSAALASSA